MTETFRLIFLSTIFLSTSLSLKIHPVSNARQEIASPFDEIGDDAIGQAEPLLDRNVSSACEAASCTLEQVSAARGVDMPAHRAPGSTASGHRNNRRASGPEMDDNRAGAPVDKPPNRRGQIGRVGKAVQFVDVAVDGTSTNDSIFRTDSFRARCASSPEPQQGSQLRSSDVASFRSRARQEPRVAALQHGFPEPDVGPQVLAAVQHGQVDIGEVQRVVVRLVTDEVAAAVGIGQRRELPVCTAGSWRMNGVTPRSSNVCRVFRPGVHRPARRQSGFPRQARRRRARCSAPPPPTVSTIKSVGVSPSRSRPSAASIVAVFTSRQMLPTMHNRLPRNRLVKHGVRVHWNPKRKRGNESCPRLRFGVLISFGRVLDSIVHC